MRYRDTCRLMIRKIQFAPLTNKPGPKADITKQFMMSDKPIQLEASLEKEVGNKEGYTQPISSLNMRLPFRSITTGSRSPLT